MSNDAQSQVNPFAAQQQLLIERLHHLLETLHAVLYDDVVRALEVPGKLLSRSHSEVNSFYTGPPAGSWSLLTLLVAQHVAPEIDLVCASSVAIALECFICALDLLDDVEDDDQTPIVQALGAARTLNVSTTLLMLAQKAILSLSQQDVPPERILSLLSTLQESALVATAGQHRDLLAERRLAQDLTQEECIEIAAGKAGSLMCLACRLGALCASADNDLCEQFSEFGELLGIAHQLDNDCHDLYYLLQGHTSAVLPTDAKSAPGSIKTDLVRGKKTLPVVIAARARKDDILKSIVSLTDEENKEYLRTLHEGIMTTWGICLLYRERARDRLQEIEAQQPISPMLRLLLGL
ncbi:MAG: polyprenyl synthetase family protein [Ktedonobacteraceae bacterium]